MQFLKDKRQKGKEYMNKEIYCSNEDISNMILDYQNGKTVRYISQKYNRSMSTVIIKLTEAGVYNKRNLNLTEKDMEFIKEKYSNGNLEEIFAKYPKLTKSNLLRLMSKNKIKSNYKWSKEETNLLIDNYDKISLQKLCDMLPNRNYKSINIKAAKLGLTKSRIWSDDEERILYNNYSSMKVEDVCKLLPNRTRDAIIIHAEKMGLKNMVDYKNEQYQILINNWKRCTDDELSIMMGCSKRSVRANRVKYGLFKNNYERSCCSYLSAYIRENNNEWKMDSIKNCNYKCVVSGKRFDDVHHIHGFNLIFAETLENISFEINKSFEDFTEEELNSVLNEFKRIQSKYPMGVCLSKDVHMEFHKQYGYGNNTEEQWNEFIKKIIA